MKQKKKRPGEEFPKTSKELVAPSLRRRQRARAMLEPRALRESTAAAAAEGAAAGTAAATAESAGPPGAGMVEKKKDGKGRKGKKGKGPGKKPAPTEEGQAPGSSTGKLSAGAGAACVDPPLSSRQTRGRSQRALLPRLPSRPVPPGAARGAAWSELLGCPSGAGLQPSLPPTPEP